VLNLTIAMIAKLTSSIILWVLLILSPQYQGDSIRIVYPRVGDSVQGIVEISGTLATSSFNYAEVFFAYAAVDNLNWFMIGRIDQPVSSGLIARWDTTTITDGVYQLKLRVHNRDESVEELIINPVIVRNYSIIPTNTPVAEVTSSIKVATTANTTEDIQYATPLPENPASTSSTSLNRSVTAGLIASGISLLLLFSISLIRGRPHLK
jgi:hypothetical protein